MADLDTIGKIDTIHVYSGGVFFTMVGSEERFNLPDGQDLFPEKLALLLTIKSVNADLTVWYRYKAAEGFNSVTGVKWNGASG